MNHNEKESEGQLLFKNEKVTNRCKEIIQAFVENDTGQCWISVDLLYKDGKFMDMFGSCRCLSVEEDEVFVEIVNGVLNAAGRQPIIVKYMYAGTRIKMSLHNNVPINPNAALDRDTLILANRKPLVHCASEPRDFSSVNPPSRDKKKRNVRRHSVYGSFASSRTKL